jgi:hypothetical protein
VIKNPAEANQIFQGKKEQIDTIKAGSIKLNENQPTDSQTETISEPIRKPKTQQRRPVGAE